MNELRKQAYRIVLSAGLLHLKWDLASWIGRSTESITEYQRRQAECASSRAFAFHNLAIIAASDFDGFSEETFWDDVERFHSQYPDAICPYRQIFDRVLNGQEVHIIAPDGVGGA